MIAIDIFSILLTVYRLFAVYFQILSLLNLRIAFKLEILLHREKIWK